MGPVIVAIVLLQVNMPIVHPIKPTKEIPPFMFAIPGGFTPGVGNFGEGPR